MKNILAKRSESNVSLIRSELNRIQNELEILRVQKVVQFGSSARGEAGLDSDLDLIVVMDSEESFPERIVTLYKILKPRVAVDLLVYTPAEFEEMKENNFFLRDVLREGRTLYEANS